MITEVFDRLYDLGVNGTGQIYLKPFFWLVMRTPLIFFYGRKCHILNKSENATLELLAIYIQNDPSQ